MVLAKRKRAKLNCHDDKKIEKEQFLYAVRKGDLRPGDDANSIILGSIARCLATLFVPGIHVCREMHRCALYLIYKAQAA